MKFFKLDVNQNILMGSCGYQMSISKITSLVGFNTDLVGLLLFSVCWYIKGEKQYDINYNYTYNFQ